MGKSKLPRRVCPQSPEATDPQNPEVIRVPCVARTCFPGGWSTGKFPALNFWLVRHFIADSFWAFVTFKRCK